MGSFSNIYRQLYHGQGLYYQHIILIRMLDVGPVPASIVGQVFYLPLLAAWGLVPVKTTTSPQAPPNSQVGQVFYLPLLVA